MDFEHLLSRMALALGIGLLVGLERTWRRRGERAETHTTGIRTFAVSALLGGIVGATALATGLGSLGGGIVLGAGFASYAASITVLTWEESTAEGNVSTTTSIAAMLTFALGAYSLIGDPSLAAATGVVATALLATREELHEWVTKITWPELRSGLVLLAMTFIALPIVPAEPIGPFGGVNPRDVWVIAIVLALVSFVGYAAVRIWGGSRGVVLAAATGGLVSSTAVTVANARRAAAGEAAPRVLASGVAVATVVSLLRVLAIVAALQSTLIQFIAPALLAAAVAASGVAVLLLYRATSVASQPERVEFRNPFGFWSTVGFAFFLGLIILLGRAVGEAYGTVGVTVGALVVGLTDVDSVTVSMVRLVPDALSAKDASVAILAAVGSNTLGKFAIGAAIGRGWFALQLGLMTVLCFAAAGAVFAVTLAMVHG